MKNVSLLIPKAREIRSSFRRLDSKRHPALLNLSRDEMYDDGEMMAPGGIYLAQIMAENLRLSSGQTVMDLGCGRGQTSAFLASRYGVNVVSVDLWTSNAERMAKAATFGVKALVTPFQGEIRRGLPVELGNFDAIFCMQSFHSFGTGAGILSYLGSLLRTGGRICIAQTCFDTEVENLPDVFVETDGWNAEYGKYHSPDWWRAFFESNGTFEVDLCREILDGDVFWEDEVLYRGNRCGWTSEYVQKSAWLTRQLIWGKSNSPSLTHFILVATK